MGNFNEVELPNGERLEGYQVVQPSRRAGRFRGERIDTKEAARLARAALLEGAEGELAALEEIYADW